MVNPVQSSAEAFLALYNSLPLPFLQFFGLVFVLFLIGVFLNFFL